MKGNFKRIVGLSSIGVLSALSSVVFAAGYKLEFQSASVLADAGEAAVVEDAGTNWYNAAGLVYLPKQAVISAIEVYAPTRFSGTVVAPSAFGPAFSFVGSGRSSSQTTNVLPAYHLSWPITKCISAGFSIVPAWGFIEYYGSRDFSRYDLVRVYTKTLDLSPSIAYKWDDHWSFAAGPDFHYFSASSKSHVRTEGPALLGGTFGDSVSRFSGERWATGAHAGILFRLNEATRVGLAYRSKMVMKLRGHSDFDLNGEDIFETDKFGLRIPLPSTVLLSLYHDVDPCWALMGTIAFDQWGTLRNYRAQNLIQPPTPTNPSGIVPSVVQVQNMHDTLDFSFGTHYKLTEKLMLRGSFKYIQTPTVTKYRDINFPDADKYGLQIGSRYKITKKIAVDLIYGHVFISKAKIHNVNPVTFSVATGYTKTHIDFFGGQFVINI